jgi:hypothetical protein
MAGSVLEVDCGMLWVEDGGWHACGWRRCVLGQERGGSTLQVWGWRRRCSEAGVEAGAAEIEDRKRLRCLGRPKGKRLAVWNVAKCCEIELGAWNFRSRAPNARHAYVTCISLFLWWETRVIWACLSFHWKGRQAHSSVSHIWSKSEMHDIRTHLHSFCIVQCHFNVYSHLSYHPSYSQAFKPTTYNCTEKLTS